MELTLSQTGLAMRLLGFVIAGVSRRYTEMEAQGLKQRCEEISSLERSADVR